MFLRRLDIESIVSLTMTSQSPKRERKKHRITQTRDQLDCYQVFIRGYAGSLKSSKLHLPVPKKLRIQHLPHFFEPVCKHTNTKTINYACPELHVVSVCYAKMTASQVQSYSYHTGVVCLLLICVELHNMRMIKMNVPVWSPECPSLSVCTFFRLCFQLAFFPQ